MFNHEYVVSKHYISAIVYGDYSGLTDIEELALDAFMAACTAQLPDNTSHHWDIGADGDFRRCDVCGLMADTVTITLRIMHTTPRKAYDWFNT